MAQYDSLKDYIRLNHLDTIVEGVCFSRTLRLHKNTYFTAYSNAESDLDVLAVM